MTFADTVWTGSVPSATYNDGDLYGYFVVATDNIGQTDTSDLSLVRAGNSPISIIKNQNDDGTLEMEGIVARITGTVSAGTGTYSTGRIEAYLQDTTAGVLVIKFGTDTPTMVENNSYTVTGKIIQYNGLIEIEPIDANRDIIDNGAVGTLQPMEASIHDINNNPEYFESRLVKILGVNLSDRTPWLGSGSSGSSMDIYVGTDTLTLRVDADTDIWGTTSPQFPLDITGVLGQYDRDSPYTEGYQLLPRKFADFDSGTAVEDENNIPTVYLLEQNYPNPFNPSTTIKYQIPNDGMVSLKIYDINGQLVKTLVNKEQAVGKYSVTFDASSLSSGIYLYKLQSNSFNKSLKMLLIK